MDDKRLKGTLTRIRYHKEDYLIGILKDENGITEDGIKVLGNMNSPQVGLEYTLDGHWEKHPKWGIQFKFTDYNTSLPANLDAVRSYLMENCKFIGPSISKRLISNYGKDTLRICKENPKRVASEISGITAPRAKKIAKMLRDKERSEELQLFLKEILGGTKISFRQVNQIIEKWGPEAPARIRENPYALIDAIDGIGFLKADEVARKLGYNSLGAPRLQAGILHTLKKQALSNGHTCLPRKIILMEAEKILGVPSEKIDMELNQLREKGVIKILDGFVYLKCYHEDETLVAKRLKALVSQTLPTGQPDFKGLADDQREALNKAVTNGVFILTGAPGTGKTYTIKRIINSFPEAKKALAAPTGKAAKRIYEQSGQVTSTIHRLLEAQKKDDGFFFARNAENTIEADLIVLDEVGMVDTPLMARFLEAVKLGTRLILVGDSYQLPSIGPGNILKDLIASEAIPSAELKIIKRQDEGLIVRNCHRIKNGVDIETENSVNGDFFFFSCEDLEVIRQMIIELLHLLPEELKVDRLREMQVIVPLREKTILSCRALNEVLQEEMNAAPKIDGVNFKVGDKVIQTKNKYDLDIMNGDIGYVRDIDKPEEEIRIEFENPPRLIDLPLYKNELELAYAITCHKFQGSEAKIVIIPIHRSFGPWIMQRNWIYTAISRAQKTCILLGQREEVPQIIRRNREQRRFTRLKEILR